MEVGKQSILRTGHGDLGIEISYHISSHEIPSMNQSLSFQGDSTAKSCPLGHECGRGGGIVHFGLQP